MHNISGPANRDIPSSAKETVEFTSGSNKGSHFSNTLKNIENTADDLVAGAPYHNKTGDDLLLSIFATGILKADFASRMGIPSDAISEASSVDHGKMGKALTANETLKVLENVLKTVRFLYKGSRIKSSNKIKTNRDMYHIQETLFYEIESQKLFETSTQKALEYCVTHEFGNCGVMARIAYALCHKLGLKPGLALFRSDGSFAHEVCRVNVNNEFYMVEAWANYICHENDFLSMLRDKMIKWNLAGKSITNGTPFDFIGEEEFEIPKNALASPDDALKLKLVKSQPIKGEHNIVSADFFTFLGDKLAEKFSTKRLSASGAAVQATAPSV
jgi:hypothetical protein